MEFKDIMAVSAKRKTTPIKGKDYIQVNERVLAFRELFPQGSIKTQIIHFDNEVAVVQASVFDDNGQHLADGLCKEFKNAPSSLVNKTSYLENCETGAIGRALGFVGIGIETSIASAEELENAILNQEEDGVISAQNAKNIKHRLEELNADAKNFLKNLENEFGREIASVDDIRLYEYPYAIELLNMKEKQNEKNNK